MKQQAPVGYFLSSPDGTFNYQVSTTPGYPDAFPLYKEPLSQVCDISLQQEIVGPSGDKLSDFRDDQWWVHELNTALSDGTPDQRRALAVVRNLLKTVKTHLTTQKL